MTCIVSVSHDYLWICSLFRILTRSPGNPSWKSMAFQQPVAHVELIQELRLPSNHHLTANHSDEFNFRPFTVQITSNLYQPLTNYEVHFRISCNNQTFFARLKEILNKNLQFAKGNRLEGNASPKHQNYIDDKFLRSKFIIIDPKMKITYIQTTDLTCPFLSICEMSNGITVCSNEKTTRVFTYA